MYSPYILITYKCLFPFFSIFKTTIEKLRLRLSICVGCIMMIQLCIAQPMSRCGSIAPVGIDQEVVHVGEAMTRNEIILPIVFHVVWSNPEENISEELLRSQLQVINDDFNRLNPDIINVPQRFQDDVSSIGIRFCLAQQDPEGNPHPGIIRAQTAVEFIGGQKEAESNICLLYTSPSPRDLSTSRMPSSA